MIGPAMKAFVFEQLSGGITSDQASGQPLHLLRQGGAMLRATAADFLDLGAQVSTMLHPGACVRRDGLNVVPVDSEADIGPTFDQLAGDADVVLIIAPESNGVLVAWLRRLADLGATTLGCLPEAAQLCGDKLAAGRHLNAAGIPTPATELLCSDTDELDLTSPVVVKPRYGVGCDDTFVCRTHADIAALNSAEERIVQPFVPGLAASCSLIVHGSKLTPLLTGEQFVRGNARLTYQGGRVPLDGDLAIRAQRLGAAAAAGVPGLGGFVGVDMILGDQPEDDRVIEINPRLTLSYVVLRMLCTTNLAAAMLDPKASIAWSDMAFRFGIDGTPTGT